MNRTHEVTGERVKYRQSGQIDFVKNFTLTSSDGMEGRTTSSGGYCAYPD